MKIVNVGKNNPNSSTLKFNGVDIVSPIREAYASSYVELEDRLIVQFWGPKDLQDDNVFAFDRQGKIIWKVERYREPDRLFPSPYVSLKVDSDNNLVMQTWGEDLAHLDPMTGKIKRIGGGRWDSKS